MGPAGEAGAVVVIHAGDAGYTKFLSDWGESTRYTGLKSSPLTEALSLGVERPIFDMMAAMVCHGLFDRHPALKVATVELGSAGCPICTAGSRLRTERLPNCSSATRSSRCASTCGSRPSTRTRSRRCGRSKVPTESCSAPTGRTPRGLPTPRSAVADYECLGAEDMRKALHENQKALTGTR